METLLPPTFIFRGVASPSEQCTLRYNSLVTSGLLDYPHNHVRSNYRFETRGLGSRTPGVEVIESPLSRGTLPNRAARPCKQLREDASWSAAAYRVADYRMLAGLGRVF